MGFLKATTILSLLWVSQASGNTFGLSVPEHVVGRSDATDGKSTLSNSTVTGRFAEGQPHLITGQVQPSAHLRPAINPSPPLETVHQYPDQLVETYFHGPVLGHNYAKDRGVCLSGMGASQTASISSYCVQQANHQQDCFASCYMEKMNWMNAEGVVNRGVVREHAKTNDHLASEALLDLSDECVDKIEVEDAFQVQQSRCEKAQKLYDCVQADAHKAGLGGLPVCP